MPGEDVDPWAIEPWEPDPAGGSPATAGGVLTAARDGWPAVIAGVLDRDRRCIFADMGPIVRLGASVQRGIPGHFCRTAFGEPIPWWRDRSSIADRHRRRDVELDHVKHADELAMSMKAADDEAHLVVVCHGAHHGGLATSKEGRAFSRAWLAALYPDVWIRPAGSSSRR